MPQAIGIDIGGTGIKSAAVDLATGELVTKRRSMDTPVPATTEAVSKVVARLLKRDGLPEIETVGAAFPAVIKHGIATTASNIDESWKGADVARVLGRHRVPNTPALQRRAARRPDHVRRDALARKLRLVDHQHMQALARQEHRDRRPAAAGADHDHVKHARP